MAEEEGEEAGGAVGQVVVGPVSVEVVLGPVAVVAAGGHHLAESP